MDPITALIIALIAVESGGDPNAIGDKGLAVGVLQIHPCVVGDVNAHYTKAYKLSDRTDPEKSKEICRLYLQYWVTETRLGHKPTNEDYARIWNGGPRGHKNPKTLGYWNKVKQQLGG